MKTAIPPLDQVRRKEIIFSFLEFSFPLLLGNALIQPLFFAKISFSLSYPFSPVSLHVCPLGAQNHSGL